MGQDGGGRPSVRTAAIDSHVHVGRSRARWDDTRPVLESVGIDTAVLAADPDSLDLEGDRALPGALSRAGGPYGLWYIGGNPFAGLRRGPVTLPASWSDYVGVEWHCYFSEGFDYGGSDEIAAAEAVERMRSREGRQALEALDGITGTRLPIRLTENLPITLALIERCPEATFIIPHFGLRNGGTSRVINALAGTPRVCFDTGVVEPNEGMVGRVGFGRVLFGSDAPTGNCAWALRAVRNLDLPAEAIAAILGGNAQRVFGL